MKLPFFPSAAERSGDALADIILQNMFPAMEEALLRQLGRQGPALIDFFGTTRFSEIGAGPIRGVFYYPGAGGTILFVVTGTTLYKIAANTSATSLGTISGSDPIIWDMIRDTLLVNADGKAWYTDGSTLTQITDVDLGTIGAIAAMDGRMLAARDAADSFVWSDVFAPGTIGALSFATAETYGDRLLRIIVHQRRIYLLGERSLELWGTGSSSSAAFIRMGNAVEPIGLGAKMSVALAGPVLFFVGVDQTGTRSVQMFDQGLGRCSTVAIDRLLQGLSEANFAAINAFAFTMMGQTFYQMDLPGLGSYAYHVQTKTWLRRKWGADTLWRGQCATYAYGKVLFGSRTDGKLYTLDLGVHVDDSGGANTALERIATAYIPAESNTRIASLKIEGATRSASGTPTAAISMSDDDGQTFGSERTVNLPKSGARTGTDFGWGLARAPGKLVKVRATGDFGLALENLRVNEPMAQ